MFAIKSLREYPLTCFSHVLLRCCWFYGETLSKLSNTTLGCNLFSVRWFRWPKICYIFSKFKSSNGRWDRKDLVDGWVDRKIHFHVVSHFLSWLPFTVVNLIDCILLLKGTHRIEMTWQACGQLIHEYEHYFEYISGDPKFCWYGGWLQIMCLTHWLRR